MKIERQQQGRISSGIKGAQRRLIYIAFIVVGGNGVKI
jgi:hypothetical protein